MAILGRWRTRSEQDVARICLSGKMVTGTDTTQRRPLSSNQGEKNLDRAIRFWGL